MEKLQIGIECKDCKSKIIADATNVKKKTLKVNGNSMSDGSIEVVYVDCPICGSRHFVQIDDRMSLELKNKNMKMFVKLAKKKIDYERIPKKDAATFEKLRKKLSDLRATLMERYEGSDVTDTETGETFQLHFTIC